MKRMGIVVVLATMMASVPTVASAAAGPYTDVSSSYYAATAIRVVSRDNTWMATSGSYFRPTARVTRRQLAVTLVRAFAPLAVPDPTIVFTDLPKTNSSWRYAAIAKARGWLPSDATFDPLGRVSKRELDRALVRAVGLQTAANALGRIKTADGYRFKKPTFFPYSVLASEMRLHYNFPSANERPEMYPWDSVNRAAAAYSIWRAKDAASGWQVHNMRRFERITLPAMTLAQRKAAEFAMQYVGYPYVYAGEWASAVSSGYCCGTQVQGGFDCSGFVWWVMKRTEGVWRKPAVRPYAGWNVPGRRARDVAKVGTRYSYANLKPMDQVSFDTDRIGTGSWDSTGHAGLYLGNGWMIHSSGGRDGVTISWVQDGFWRETLLWGSRIIK